MQAAEGRLVLGVNLSHDMACAAVRDGRVEVAVAEERLNRVKYCTGLTEYGRIVPWRGIRYCCSALGCDPREVDLWVVNSCRAGARRQLQDQLVGIEPSRVVDLGHPGHHLAHAHSAFDCSPFASAAVLVLDTNGGFVEAQGRLLRKEHYACYAGGPDGLREVFKDWVEPGEVSVGELYCLYSAALQLTPQPHGAYGNDCALSAGGKLMGLAAWDRERAALPALLRVEERRLGIALADVLGRLRELGRVDGERPPPEIGQLFGFQLRHHVRLERRRGSLRRAEHLRLAGEAQRLLEEAVLALARRAQRETGLTDLCLAGGCFLNVVASTRILEETPFRRVFVQPAAGDAGNAIGAAMWGYRRLGGRQRPYLAQPYSTYLGRAYSADEVQAAAQQRLSGLGLCWQELPDEAQRARALAGRLARGELLAVFRGRSEFGPRALGHRSFLAAPWPARVRERLNRVKGREWYRPVAPVLPREELARFFDAPYDESPFMTLAARARTEARERAPAVCHVDGSARPQTVSAGQEPFLHRLLLEFGAATGLPLLVNTSLNLRGQPLVETPDEAAALFLADERVDALLLEDLLVARSRT